MQCGCKAMTYANQGQETPTHMLTLQYGLSVLTVNAMPSMHKAPANRDLLFSEADSLLHVSPSSDIPATIFAAAVLVLLLSDALR